MNTSEKNIPPARHSGPGHLPVPALLLAGGLRFARDAFGPLLVFYLVWSLIGFDAGIAAATGLAVATYVWERRQTRSGLSAGIGLGVALAQALAGLVSTDPIGYFAPPLIVNGVCGVAFLMSVAIGRPLAGVSAAETYPFPPQVQASMTFRRVCSRISLVWATYLLLGSAVRLEVLLRSGVDLYVLVNFLTGFPFMIGLMGWSVWYGLRSVRRNENWVPGRSGRADQAGVR